MKKTLIFFVSILLIISCKKTEQEIIEPKPIVSFTYNLSDYGVVTFNTSATNANSFLWNFGDGETSTLFSPRHVYQTNGNFTCTLTATGKGGTSNITQTVNVNTVTGNAVFWKSDSRYNLEVTVDGKYQNYITGYYSSGTPSCDAQYCANFAGLTEGVHTFTAKESGRLFPSTWKGSITIIGGNCSKMQLNY